MQSRLAKGLLAFTVSVVASAFVLGPSALLGAEKVVPKASASPPQVIHSIKNDKSGPLRLAHPPTKPFTGGGREAARNEGSLGARLAHVSARQRDAGLGDL